MCCCSVTGFDGWKWCLFLCSEDAIPNRDRVWERERERKSWILPTRYNKWRQREREAVRGGGDAFYNDIKNWSVTSLSGSYHLLTSWGYDSTYFALTHNSHLSPLIIHMLLFSLISYLLFEADGKRGFKISSLSKIFWVYHHYTVRGLLIQIIMMLSFQFRPFG